MRVTSASASINSLVASAASRTLYDFARSEPGMTRIFGTAMADDGWRIQPTCYAHTRPCPTVGRQPLRYTHTRAGGIFIHPRSDDSALTRSSRFGIGATAL